jgi:hypothetical protein
VPGGRVGLAVLALVFGLPALALYNTTLAVFAVVIAGLRLVSVSQRLIFASIPTFVTVG